MEKLQQTNKKTDQDLQWKKKKDKVMAEISNVRNANKMVSKGND